MLFNCSPLSLLLILACTDGICWSNGETLMREYPMIIAHDAGTTYLKHEEAIVQKEVLAFTKTQPDGGFGRLFDCGVRALDIRPKNGGSKGIIMHHGIVPVPTKLFDAIDDIKAWSKKNPNELLLLYFSHFDSSKTRKITKKILHMKSIPFFENNSLAEMTVENAIAIGPILAVFDQVKENYDPSVVCEKTVNFKEYLCFDESTKEDRISQLRSYVQQISSNGSRNTGLWMTQAHWQYNPLAISIAVTHDSSILKDSSASQVNHILARDVASGKYPPMNLVEIDNACDGGAQLLSVLRNRTAIGRSFKLARVDEVLMLS